MTNGENAMVEAATWIMRAVEGPLVLSLSTLAIVALGFAMLTGRLSFRRVGIVVAGIAVAVGASAIAKGLMNQSLVTESRSPPPFQPASPPPHPPNRPQAADKDPYAGAALPDR